MQVLVRGGDQARVVGFGHRAALALAPAVDADLVEQAARLPGLRHTRPATDTRPEPLPDTLTSHAGFVPTLVHRGNVWLAEVLTGHRGYEKHDRPGGGSGWCCGRP